MFSSCLQFIDVDAVSKTTSASLWHHWRTCLGWLTAFEIKGNCVIFAMDYSFIGPHSDPKCFSLDGVWILEAVSSGEEPAAAHQWCSTHMAIALYLQAHLPGPWTRLGICPSHDFRPSPWSSATPCSSKNSTQSGFSTMYGSFYLSSYSIYETKVLFC